MYVHTCVCVCVASVCVCVCVHVYVCGWGACMTVCAMNSLSDMVGPQDWILVDGWYNASIICSGLFIVECYYTMTWHYVAHVPHNSMHSSSIMYMLSL